MTAPIVHTRGATISTDGRFRTRLWRIWSEYPRLLFIGLNPSTADEEANDATVSWLIRWAFANGFGGLEIGNLYALRTKDPRELKAARYPVGPDNDKSLLALARCINHDGGVVVAGWGNHAQPNRALDFRTDLMLVGVPLLAWGFNKNGSPKHPLYLPGGAETVPFPDPFA